MKSIIYIFLILLQNSIYSSSYISFAMCNNTNDPTKDIKILINRKINTKKLNKGLIFFENKSLFEIKNEKESITLADTIKIKFNKNKEIKIIIDNNTHFNNMGFGDLVLENNSIVSWKSKKGLNEYTCVLMSEI